jgi:KipI family sensor histidine kinase inhibitor
LEWRTAGDSALLIRFGDEIDEGVSAKVRAARLVIDEEHIGGIVEIVPTYCSLYIFYDPLRVETEELVRKLEAAIARSADAELPPPRVIETPVVYGGEYGPDLEDVAKLHGITPEEAIGIHSSKDYLVYMLGFTPGFPFCGSVDDAIATPRKKDPRVKIPPGSVGIAGKQTGVYAIASPGGWQLIGRTYRRFFDPSRAEPIGVRAGDYIRFVPVTPEEFEANRAEIDAADAPPDYSGWEPGGEAMFETLSPGALTTIQDRGRYGYQELGISRSGAMDEISFRAANRLAGNDENAPALEITMTGPRFKVLGEALISVTGADMSPTLDGKPLPMYKAALVSPGSVVGFGAPVSGVRAYLAVSGGFSVPLVMGSASTGVNARIGGFKGRKLERGDILNRAPAAISKNFIGCSVDPAALNFAPEDGAFRVIPGPEAGRFAPEGIKTFYSSEYKISEKSDRMGSRLEGPKIAHGEKGPGMISDGVTLGSVQVPGEGYPLVLLKERQAVGGYPKIATVCTVDAFRLGQARPGDAARFREITLGEAHDLLRRMEYAITGIGAREKFLEKHAIADADMLRVTIGGRTYNVFVEKK